MMQVVYYAIYPNNELSQKLRRSMVDSAELLLEKELWSRNESLHFYAPRDIAVAERMEKVKLMFLARLFSDYLDSQSAGDEFQLLVHELLEPPGLRVSTFDKWWCMDRIEGVSFVCEEMELDLAEILQSNVVREPGSRLDEWLSDLERLKAEGRRA